MTVDNTYVEKSRERRADIRAVNTHTLARGSLRKQIITKHPSIRVSM